MVVYCVYTWLLGIYVNVPLNVVHARGDRVRVEAKIGYAAKVSVAIEVVEPAVPNVPTEGRGTEGEASV